MVIKFIYGMSGCSKTTTAIKLLKNKLNFDFNCIAFTHSAVNNLKDKYIKMMTKKQKSIGATSSWNIESIPNYAFQTIHKFLRIPIDERTGTYTIIRHSSLKIKSIVIIDEFSLIPLDIINYLFEIATSTEYMSINFIFVGDFIQLQPISTISQPINLNLLKSDFSNITLNFNQAIRIADHLSNSVYTTKYFKESKKLILNHNYRNGTNIINILNDVLDNYNFKKYIISNYDIKKYVEDGYVVLSSMYKHLEMAYTFAIPQNKIKGDGYIYKTKIGNIKISKGDRFILNENVDIDFVNGDEVEIINLLDTENKVEIRKYVNKDKNSSENSFRNEKSVDATSARNDNLNKDNEINEKDVSIVIPASKLIPYNFITCHKAQGKTIPKVLLILDDLFEITMLYTAITRASEDVKFIKFKYLPDKSDIEAFKIMRNVIYFTQHNEE